ncbi:ROK family transcriptional regulator [Acetobacteraceae bacterium H6797]|nr:ROK family transcriptional regulator [Acetobacteraceae bacterium H6797]
MQDQPRSRRQTRAAILGRLLATGGLYRTRLAAESGLSEGSVSRIIGELRSEGLVEEPRRPVPYPGGPSSIVALRKDQRIAGLEFANDRLAVGVGNFAGEADTTARYPLPAGSAPALVRETVIEAVAGLAEWCRRQGVAPRHIAASLPGFRGMGPLANPIVPVDTGWLDQHLRESFPGVPVTLGNTVAVHAAAQLHGRGVAMVERRKLFLYLGHGVGGAWVEPITADDPIRPIEIGHVVLDPEGAACRCGHRGCLETQASLVALAGLFEVPEAELAAAGPHWMERVRLTARREASLRAMLRRLGLVIGNALNLQPAARVVLCGWPAGLPEGLRTAIAEGMGMSLFGGLGEGAPPLEFLAPLLGAEPAPSLAYALHCLIREGGMAQQEDRPARLAG